MMRFVGVAVVAVALSLPALAQERPLKVKPSGDLALLAGADPAAGERVWRQCRVCHGVDAGWRGVGPALAGVLGRPVASAPGFPYSRALAEMGGDWTVARLSAYLADPRAAAPGTTMAYAGLRDPQDRLNLIAWLARQGG